jgi:hypothetical protein
MKVPSRFAPCLALLAALLPAPAQAERYRVDLIVFADLSGAGDEAPLPWQAPNLKQSLELYETAQLRASGIEILPDESFALTEAWSRLRNSRNHRPLLRLAWIQKDPPAERGVSLHLRAGNPQADLAPTGGASTYPVDGSVALLVGRFLHLDADLAYTEAGAAGELKSYRLRERRLLRRDELHHLDSPKLGILVRAQRAEPKGEPKAPAAPPKKSPPRKKP